MLKKFKVLYNRLRYSPENFWTPNFLNWLDDIKVDVILDVGANNGQSAEHYKEVFPNKLILSFEPQKESFDILMKRMEGYPYFKAFNIALGEYDEEYVQFFKNNYSPSSSLLQMSELHKKVHPHTAETTKDYVKVKKLDSIINELEYLGKKNKYFLKMDTQGYEYRILKGACDTLKQTQVIFSELLFQPLYEQQSKFEEISAFLYDNGFQFCGVLSQGRKNPKNGLYMYSDGIFIKKELL